MKKMKKMKKITIICLGLVLVSHLGFSQKSKVKIGNNPYTLNASAALEVESTTKGFLPPRMTQSEMNAIIAPATGLQVYCTNCSPAGLYNFNGTAWGSLVTTNFSTDITVNGLTVGKGLGSRSSNTAIGVTALKGNTSGDVNTAVGAGALLKNTAGSLNTAVGATSLNTNLIGNSNTALGFGSLYNVVGDSNTAQGVNSLYNITSGNSNIGLGIYSGAGVTTGSNNIFIGNQNDAGPLGVLGITTGSYNTIIGSKITGLSQNLTNNIILADGHGTIHARYNNGWTFGTVAFPTSGTLVTLDGTDILTNKTINGLTPTALETGFSIAGGTTSKTLTVSGDAIVSGTNSGDQTNIMGNAGTATNIAAGTLGAVPYQSGVGTTGFLAGNLTSKSQMLISKGTGTVTAAPFWSNVDDIAVPYTGATAAVNLGDFDLTVNGLTVGKGKAKIEFNTAVGLNSLKSDTTTGNYNTAIGASALEQNTTGASNTAQGYYSLQMNESGNGNTAQGDHSLAKIMAGVGNVGIGKSSLETLEGSSNTAVGTNSGKGLTGGDKNIFIGSQTSDTGITTGSNNTIIGSNITGLAANLSNNVILADGVGNIRAQHDGTSWNLGDVKSKSVVFSGTTSGTATLAAPNSPGTSATVNSVTTYTPATITLPSKTGTLATLDGSETLTNKTINGVTPTVQTTGFSIAGGSTTSKTLTVSGNLTTSGGFDTTLTSTAETDVTLPTTGTLATLDGSETLTNKTINGVALTAQPTGFSIAGGTTIKRLTVSGNFSTSGGFDTTLTSKAATNVTLPTTGTLATLGGTETLTNKTLTAPKATSVEFSGTTAGTSAILAAPNSPGTSATVNSVTTYTPATITLPSTTGTLATTDDVKSSSRPYKVYTCHLDQNLSSGIPTMRLYENTYNETFILSKVSAGTFDLTCVNSVFPIPKTVVFITAETGTPVILGAAVFGGDKVVRIICNNKSGVPVDGSLLCALEIRTYP